MKRAFYSLVIFTMLCVGCVPPYNPNVNNKVIKPTPTPTIVSPRTAFEEYRLDVAKNFRTLAQRVANKEFEWVSELVDASNKLDEVSKVKRNKPIDKILGDELGSDEVDVKKAVNALLKVADELDPEHKIEIKIEDEPLNPPSKVPQKAEIPNGPSKYAEAN